MVESPPSKPRRSKKQVAAEWYDGNLDRHRRLASKMKSTLEEVLTAQGIQFDRVEARVKGRMSYLRKAGKRKYPHPIHQIKDVVGVRVITYLDATVAEVGKVIEAQFAVDWTNSLDKGEALGTDRVGYRSKHYVVTIGAKRAELAECAEFKDVPMEIQVRSLLQHAWAGIEHDRRFKYPGELPDELKRRFSLVAGQLEGADREFNSIAREIDEHAAKTALEAGKNERDEPLTLVNATAYLRGVFAEFLPSGRVEPGLGGDGAQTLLAELTAFRLRTLGDLAVLIPRDFPSKHPGAIATQTTFLGLARSAMILTDAARYFSDVFVLHPWKCISNADAEMYTKNGVKLMPLLVKYKIAVYANEGEEEEDEYANIPEDEKGECGFCGRDVPFEAMESIGAGGQDAPLACPRCVAEMDDEASDEWSSS